MLAATTVYFLGLFLGLTVYSLRIDWGGLLVNPELRAAAALTATSTGASTVLAGAAALGCAYVLSRFDFPGKALVETVLDAPMVLPPLVSGVALLIFFGPLMGNGLKRLGVAIVYTPLGVVIAQSFIALPFAVKLFREAFDAEDPRYEHIARTLGCTPAEVFFRVTLPLAKRGIASGLAMTWARTVGEFGATAMLAGITRMKTETVSAAIFLSMSAGELDVAIALSVLLLAAAACVLLILRMLPDGQRARPEIRH